MTRFAALACLMFLTACASAPQMAAAPAPSASEGYLVASIDELNPVDHVDSPMALRTLLPMSGNYVLKYRKTDQSSTGEIALIHRTLDPDNNDLKSLRRFGLVTAQKLAPGTYEIYSSSVTWRDGKKIVGTSEPISLPFTIAAGQTTYLGNFGAVGFDAKNKWGFSEPAGAHFQLSDKSERDIRIAKGKLPELGPVVKQLPKLTP